MAVVTGHSFSFGYVDGERDWAMGAGPRDPRDLDGKDMGRMDGNDTGILGSGTKGFTAAAVMRLVD
jgi:CubicO group peptidase (beta-lactamase class C family)